LAAASNSQEPAVRRLYLAEARGRVASVGYELVSVRANLERMEAEEARVASQEKAT
jgi:hypothetical protein